MLSGFGGQHMLFNTASMRGTPAGCAIIIRLTVICQRFARGYRHLASRRGKNFECAFPLSGDGPGVTYNTFIW